MPGRRWLPGGRPVPLLALLLLTLALSGVLAYQAQRAARSHRAASEGALRDYAAFASWELERRLESAAEHALAPALLHGRMAVEFTVPGEPPRDAVAAFAAAAREKLAGCGCAGAVRHPVVLELESGTARVAEPGGSAALREWAEGPFLAELRAGADTLSAARAVTVRQAQGTVVRHVAGSALEMRAVPVPPLGPSAVLVYTLGADAGGRPTRVYGLVVDARALVRPLMAQIADSAALLPPSLTRGARNAEVLSLAVHARDGSPVFRAGGSPAAGTAVVDTLGPRLGGLVTRVAVRPEVAGRLVIGGLPRSRLPLLVGVFALTLGLVGVAVLQLRRQQELLRLRGEFVAGVSHELRTPLAQIRLFSDLLESGRLREEQQRRSVRIIGEEARRLTYLVENVLRFSRAERHADRIAPEPTEAAPLVREIVDAFAPLARSAGARIEVEAQEGVVAHLDRDAVRQVLLNLLDNAVKYGPRGQRIVVGAAREGGHLVLRVDDQGPGVPREERGRVWEPYRRLARDVESATGGSGIGLAVVRELVELHRGETSVEDAPGGGARFTVRLPLGPRPAAAAPSDTLNATAGA